MHEFLEFEQELKGLRRSVVFHPVFAQIQSVEALRVFMKSHVFAVWDFMSLLKTLQRQITCTSTPWLPPPNARAARFINEIVLGEETDEIAKGEYLSHFELYLKAMHHSGADMRPIQIFLERLREGEDLDECFFRIDTSPFVAYFVKTTLNICRLEPHMVAAAFLFGREDVIPDMFLNLLSRLGLMASEPFRWLKIYLERHIEVDGESHGPLSRQLLESLCGASETRWQEARIVARQAMMARRQLWDGISYELQAKRILSPLQVSSSRDNSLQELSRLEGQPL